MGRESEVEELLRKEGLPVKKKENISKNKLSSEQREVIKRSENKLTKNAIYTGESGKSTFIRLRQHVDQWRGLLENSFMLKHFVKNHMEENTDNFKFTFKVVSNHLSAFERQI